MDRSEVAVVIPALNESATIHKVVQNVINYGVPVVIDDCSDDDTGLIAREAGASVIRHEQNKGYDGAINSGFNYASNNKFKYIITLDADGQHNPSVINKFIAPLESDTEIVVGIRHKKARISEKVFALMTRLLYGIKDPLCGIKAYRTELYNELGHFDSYHSIGTELLLYALKKRKKFTQLNIEVGEREEGAPRFAGSFRANYKIFRAMLIGLLKKY